MLQDLISLLAALAATVFTVICYYIVVSDRTYNKYSYPLFSSLHTEQNLGTAVEGWLRRR